ncbi:MAG: hypothetical protein N3B16_04515 [Candidatus Aminicenantes bacterium]|nr:hypothetical protein [Candidatus Aminicenantes bacterium]
MRRIRMIKTSYGSPDGIQVFQYQAGQVVSIPDDLANAFMSQGWAEEDKTLDGAMETKQSVVQGKEPGTERKIRGKKG